MAEVFTISGAAASAFGASCPAGWGATASGYCGAVGGGSALAARNLQQALVALGNAVRDPALMAIKVDGIIGPGTQGAVNRAFTTHLGAGQAPAPFRTGKLSIFEVAQFATELAKLLATETVRRGYTAPAAEAPPGPSMIPSPPTAALPEQSNTAMWALGGLALLAVGVGIYFAAGGGDSAPVARRSRA